MPPRKTKSKKQTFTVEDAKDLLEKSGHFVVTSKDRFHTDLSNNLECAWISRGSERYLYTVFSHVVSHLCDTITLPQFPTSTISHNPQALFRVQQPLIGQRAEAVSKKDVHPDLLPDFARMIFTYRDYEEGLNFGRELVDYWEIKGLNTAQRWDSAEARSAALRAINKHMEQLWKQSRAAFAHNESWTHAYALLIVGPYFSQVVWDRPAGTITPPVEDISNSGTRDTRALFDNYNERIKEAETREMPHIEFVNAPVFDFYEAGGGQAQQVSLSKHFLYAVSLPLKEHFGGFTTQPSWFEPPPDKPSPPVRDSDPEVDAAAVIRAALITDPLSRVQAKKNAHFVELSSSNDSPEDDRDDFDPSPATKRHLKTWKARGGVPFSPATTRSRGRQLGVVAAEEEDQDGDPDEAVQELMVQFQAVGSASRDNEDEEDEEDGEDGEDVDDGDEQLYADDEHTESE